MGADVVTGTPSPEQRAREAIRAAGYLIDRLFRVLPPREPGGDCEVLFRGRETAHEPVECLTAYVADRKVTTAAVSRGW